MEVSIRFNRETHKIQLPADATLEILMQHISELLNIPPENQKLVCAGKTLKSPTEAISNGMKLMLMESKPPPVMQAEKTVHRPNIFRPQIIDSLKEPYHKEIINMGLPDGAMASSKYPVNFFPQEPLFIRVTNGDRAQLSFESDAIFTITDKGESERIFFSSIYCTNFIQIDTCSGYGALGISTKNGNRWFYFIPSQFNNLIRGIIQK